MHAPDPILPTAAPSSAAPSTVTPSTATPSTATPSTATPSTATPSTATPATATPATATPAPTPDDRPALHLSLDVTDLDGAVAFYRDALGMEVTKRRPGYARVELDEPRLVLALNRSDRAGLSHLGLRLASAAALDRARARAAGAGVALDDQGETTCCYARQRKAWVADPDGHRWELYELLDDDAPRRTAAGCCP